MHKHFSRKISFKEKITHYLGNSGTGKCIGINIYHKLSDNKVHMSPVNSKNEIARCEITFPIESLPELIQTLQEIQENVKLKC